VIVSSAAPIVFHNLQLALEAGDARKGADLLSQAASVAQEAGKGAGLGARAGSPALMATTVALLQRVGVLCCAVLCCV